MASPLSLAIALGLRNDLFNFLRPDLRVSGLRHNFRARSQRDGGTKCVRQIARGTISARHGSAADRVTVGTLKLKNSYIDLGKPHADNLPFVKSGGWRENENKSAAAGDDLT
jgi:hypothetical protein